MVNIVKDELTGTGTASSRFYHRVKLKGRCTRCKEKAMPGRTIGPLCSNKLKLKYIKSKQEKPA